MNTLSAGDLLPTFEFITADGTVWTSDEHVGNGDPGRPLVLILHRHLA